MARKLVAAIACRNNGSRLYGKPLQNLDVENNVKIIDNIIDCINGLGVVDEIVLGISIGVDNLCFEEYAKDKGLKYIFGDEVDVLSRLIKCGELSEASDIFRVTSESPFLYFNEVKSHWDIYQDKNLDALFMDEIIDGCGYEIISLNALRLSHLNGQSRHRSELCSLYIRENKSKFNVVKVCPPNTLIRKDLRLTVDNPEDLVVCRKVYERFKDVAPNISIEEVVTFLDNDPSLKNLIVQYTELGYSSMNK